MKKLSPRVWLTLILVGMVGQFAWTIENMYFNVYLYNTISTDPGYISAMVGWSAAAATLTTLLMGALSDRVGKRKLFICGGYLLWGLSTAAFGLVTVKNAAKLFPAASAAAAAAVMIVVLDCVMTFFGSTANDAAFNAWITDTVPNAARGKAESVLAILPLISMLVIFGLFDGMTQRGQWQKFFAIFGGLVVLTGVVSVFLIPEPKLEPRRDNGLKTLVYGLRPSVVRGNPALYLSFAAFCLFSVAVQVFFPYLIIYMQNYLHFDGYALVLGVVLIIASVVSVLSGRVIDRLGELRCVLPAAGVMFAGLLGMFFARSMLAVILTGCIMMSGYMLVTAILSGVIRDHTPAGKAGHFQGIRMIFGVLLPMIFALFVAELYRRHENPLGNVCWELGGLVYIALPFALLATIPLRGACSAGSSYVPGDMLAIIFIVWANDVGAYLAGSLFGRHRLFERISPKKSWEGFAGGVLCAVAVGWLYGLYAGPGDTAHGLLWSGAGLVVAVAGVLGDLVESMLKRSAGLKDSGNSIPGHGGFLDRFDALILAVPFVYAYFAIFAYICVLSGGPVGAVAG